ncbi:response regulator transcription factor [Desulfosoma caldarium]|uniref:Response regulatory domain-containing protein n=1 Tax=Desulfosoma caldarium TaxID=610254 RepID=A0A3N1UR60_9BACT|nr:response regulator transcription factor [Desulfosoma caldarium]ROQ93612.1 hypothetical protein EDC27_1645 [Desulfosoma caldarium]
MGANPRNQELLSAFVQRMGYEAVRADDLDAVDDILDHRLNIKIALVDVTGFDQGVWQRCARLHGQGIPLLVISPKQSAAIRKMSFSHGAQAVLVKPLGMRELADMIHGFMQA